MTIFARRGIPSVINAAGTLTRLSGGVMRPEAMAAMVEATAVSVDMIDLQAHASAAIARITGAEAGYVTSGAAAGLLLGTAACITGLDARAMGRLPDTTGLKNEVIVARGHRNGYDHAVRAAGVRLVEVGLPERHAGAGGRDTEPSEIAEAITERTAAVLYVETPGVRPPLADVVAVAHAAGVPVIVDAAAELPPQANLTRFIALGADLVVFSGGKALGGPQSSGLLCGRRDLVMAAALQNLDLDIRWDIWNPPASLIDKTMLRGLPRHGIGRSAKVGKEEIIGVLTALELFVAEGDAARHARWLARVHEIADALVATGSATVRIIGRDDAGAIPKLDLLLDTPERALSLVRALLAHAPTIHVDHTWVDEGRVIFNPLGLRDGDATQIAAVVNATVAAAA